MGKRIDLTNKYFGEWHVKKYVGNHLWMCECSCGVVKNIDGRTLRNGKSTSCGHLKSNVQIKDNLSGKHFGEWEVISFDKNNHWFCQCSCGVIKSIDRGNLTRLKTTSCGHIKEDKKAETLIKRYGEISPNKIYYPREKWQIDTLSDKSKLENYLITLGYKITFYELAHKLGVTHHTISDKIHQYNLEDYIEINPMTSKEERELQDYIKSIAEDYEIRFNVRDIIAPYELDVFIPKLKLAIEFNGTYWHSSLFKDKKYHQHKTIQCIKQGIRLIHIFEYEWKNDNTKNKIKDLLNRVISNKTTNKVFYARKLEIIETNKEKVKQFEDRYHLQGSTRSEINLALVERDSQNILGIMTFGTPRFNNNYQYELIRLCYKHNVIIVGGAERLFKHFLKKYAPKSIISYCNIAKFSGEVYTRLGFKTYNKLTEPNYVWVSQDSLCVLSRYGTMKSKLLKLNLGNEDETEDSIMNNLGYFKVYDSGNLKFIWE